MALRVRARRGVYSQIQFCEPSALNVRFAPNATEMLRCREVTRSAITGARDLRGIVGQKKGR
jgi:hypothetical protein